MATPAATVDPDAGPIFAPTGSSTVVLASSSTAQVVVTATSSDSDAAKHNTKMSNLYLVTFLATLFILLLISGAIVMRSYFLRRRYQRRLEEALASGLVLAPRAQGGKRKRFGAKPGLFEVYVREPTYPTVSGKGSTKYGPPCVGEHDILLEKNPLGGSAVASLQWGSWETILPLSAQPIFVKRKYRGIAEPSSVSPGRLVSITPDFQPGQGVPRPTRIVNIFGVELDLNADVFPNASRERRAQAERLPDARQLTPAQATAAARTRSFERRFCDLWGIGPSRPPQRTLASANANTAPTTERTHASAPAPAPVGSTETPTPEQRGSEVRQLTPAQAAAAARMRDLERLICDAWGIGDSRPSQRALTSANENENANITPTAERALASAPEQRGSEARQLTPAQAAAAARMRDLERLICDAWGVGDPRPPQRTLASVDENANTAGRAPAPAPEQRGPGARQLTSAQAAAAARVRDFEYLLSDLCMIPDPRPPQHALTSANANANTAPTADRARAPGPEAHQLTPAQAAVAARMREFERLLSNLCMIGEPRPPPRTLTSAHANTAPTADARQLMPAQAIAAARVRDFERLVCDLWGIGDPRALPRTLTSANANTAPEMPTTEQRGSEAHQLTPAQATAVARMRDFERLVCDLWGIGDSRPPPRTLTDANANSDTAPIGYTGIPTPEQPSPEAQQLTPEQATAAARVHDFERLLCDLWMIGDPRPAPRTVTSANIPPTAEGAHALAGDTEASTSEQGGSETQLTPSQTAMAVRMRDFERLICDLWCIGDPRPSPRTLTGANAKGTVMVQMADGTRAVGVPVPLPVPVEDSDSEDEEDVIATTGERATRGQRQRASQMTEQGIVLDAEFGVNSASVALTTSAPSSRDSARAEVVLQNAQATHPAVVTAPAPASPSAPPTTPGKIRVEMLQIAVLIAMPTPHRKTRYGKLTSQSKTAATPISAQPTRASLDEDLDEVSVKSGISSRDGEYVDCVESFRANNNGDESDEEECDADRSLPEVVLGVARVQYSHPPLANANLGGVVVGPDADDDDDMLGVTASGTRVAMPSRTTARRPTTTTRGSSLGGSAVFGIPG